ncbi:hypothetical protein WN48_01648 [Eufriesea mexicana]|nr:hypothetical protein WN48_01648 [Eufriesea mexicana]
MLSRRLCRNSNFIHSYNALANTYMRKLLRDNAFYNCTSQNKLTLNLQSDLLALYTSLFFAQYYRDIHFQEKETLQFISGYTQC